MGPDFRKRQSGIKSLMKAEGLDAVFTSAHSDIFYYTGYSGLREDRTFMIIPYHGNPILIATPLESETEVRYPNTVIMEDTKDFIDQLKPFKTLGYDEKFLNVIIFKEMQKAGITLKPAGEMFEKPRIIKDSYEIEQIRKSIGIAEKVFEKVGNSPAGKSEIEVSNEIGIEMRKNGIIESFDSIVSSGKQSFFVHHKPNGRIIGKQDHVLIDIGCKYNGYCCDLTRVFFRKLDKKRKKAYEDVKHIHDSLAERMVEGETTDAISDLQERLFAGCGHEVVHGFGHGVGLTVHEPLGKTLKKNMVVTVEPGIYVKSLGGFRIENMVLIGKGKSEILSRSVPVL